MNILLLGSGGREHAIAWKIAQSPKVEHLFIAPGNAGTAQVGTNVNMKADDFAAIKDFALANQIDMVVVGPEDPLVKGPKTRWSKVFTIILNRMRHSAIFPSSVRARPVPNSKAARILPKLS